MQSLVPYVVRLLHLIATYVKMRCFYVKAKYGCIFYVMDWVAFLLLTIDLDEVWNSLVFLCWSDLLIDLHPLLRFSIWFEAYVSCRTLYPTVRHSGMSRHSSFLIGLYAVSFDGYQLYPSSEMWRCFISKFVNWIIFFWSTRLFILWKYLWYRYCICAYLLVYLTNAY